MARTAAVVEGVRTAKGAANVLLVDAGDEMQGSLLSNLQQGAPTIATFNAMGYDVATFGNHEFDWGQAVLADRTAEASYPYVTANIVVRTTPATAPPPGGHARPSSAAPYQVVDVGDARTGQGRLHRRDDRRDADHHDRRRPRPACASRTRPNRSSATTTR